MLSNASLKGIKDTEMQASSQLGVRQSTCVSITYYILYASGKDAASFAVFLMAVKQVELNDLNHLTLIKVKIHTLPYCMLNSLCCFGCDIHMALILTTCLNTNKYEIVYVMIYWKLL